MKRSFFFLFLVTLIGALGTASCSSKKIAKTSNPYSEQELLEITRIALVKRDLSTATKTLLALGSENTSEDKTAELLAQYWILQCKAKKAWNASKQINDPNKKSLFQATVLAAVSATYEESANLPIESESVAETPKKPKISKKENLDQKFKIDFESGEIWKDEWAMIQVDTRPCRFEKADPKKAPDLLVHAGKLFSILKTELPNDPTFLALRKVALEAAFPTEAKRPGFSIPTQSLEIASQNINRGGLAKIELTELLLEKEPTEEKTQSLVSESTPPILISINKKDQR